MEKTVASKQDGPPCWILHMKNENGKSTPEISPWELICRNDFLEWGLLGDVGFFGHLR